MKGIVLKFDEYVDLSKKGFEQDYINASKEIKQGELNVIIAKLKVDLTKKKSNLKLEGIRMVQDPNFKLLNYKHVFDEINILQAELNEWEEIKKALFELKE